MYFFPLKFSSYIIFCYFCNGHASPKRRVGQKLIGTETTKPFVGQVSKRRLRTLSFCEFKLRNFVTVHRDNATISVCVGRLYSNLPYYMIGLSLAVYIIFRRGLAALLIFAQRQCEGQNSGMGGSSNSHAFFCFQELTGIINC